MNPDFQDNMKIEENMDGLSIYAENWKVFFGSSTIDRQALALKNSDLDFHSLHQIHSNKCILSSKSEVEADAHWTLKKNTGLIIKTADCLPILIVTPEKALAVHGGWRGLAANIIKESILTAEIDISKALVFIGPHIQKNSFEFGAEVVPKILDSLPTDSLNTIKNQIVLPHKTDDSKRMIDMALLAKTQLMSVGIKEDQIWLSDIDTLTNEDWNSYRRDGKRSGRNLSFCAIL